MLRPSRTRQDPGWTRSIAVHRMGALVPSVFPAAASVPLRDDIDRSAAPLTSVVPVVTSGPVSQKERLVALTIAAVRSGAPRQRSGQRTRPAMTVRDRTGTLKTMAGSQEAPPPTSTSVSPPAERIVVGVTGAPSSGEVIRRAAVIAQRCSGDLVGVHVDDGHQPPAARHAILTSHRELLQSLGGRFEQVVADDVAGALVDFASRDGATQLVVGSTRRSRIASALRGSVIDDTLRRTGIDVHVVATSCSWSRPRRRAHRIPGDVPRPMVRRRAARAFRGRDTGPDRQRDGGPRRPAPRHARPGAGDPAAEGHVRARRGR